jgi:hypothetical protein
MKKKLLSLVITSVCMGAIPSAFAADDAAILKRLDQLEAKRKADQAEIDALRGKVQQLEQKNAPAAAGISSDEAAKLREEIATVDKKATSRVDSVKHAIETERDNLKVNGYMSVYGTKSTNSDVANNTGIDNHVGFKSDTIAAIQFDYKVNSNIDAVIQLQSVGSAEYQTETSLAFLRFNVSPSTKIRAGRMAAPLYLYAESIDIGYTYPWVRPPVEMYGNTGPVRFQGIDLLQNFNIADWNNSFQLFYGDSDSNNEQTGAQSNDYFAGAALTFNHDAWTVRSSYAYAKNTNVDAFASAPGNIGYLSGAVRYDDGGLFALVEGKQVRSTGELNKHLPTVDAFYGTLGYQLNEFFPYATWAKSYSTQDGNVSDPHTAFMTKQSQESLGLGLRYNLTDKVVLKGEATKYNHFDGTLGILGFADARGIAGDAAAAAGGDPVAAFSALRSAAQSLDKDGVTLMSIGFDAIF